MHMTMAATLDTVIEEIKRIQHEARVVGNAVAHAYAKKAQVMLPSLEEYERKAAVKNLATS